MASHIDKVPSRMSINRDPFWVNVPREVGDGMEAHPMRVLSSTSINSNNAKNVSPSSSSISSSRSPSPQRTDLQNHFQEDIAKQNEVFPHFSNTSVAQSCVSFTDSEKFLIEEKAALKDHLEIQIQVNHEIKKLLLASVGDDLGFHYERLSTEKAQLSKEVDDLKSQLRTKKEEIERLEISCDIWRSKYLASRLQCDDLVEWRRAQEKQTRGLESAVRGILHEHRQDCDHLRYIFAALRRLDQSLNNGRSISSFSQSMSDSEKCRNLVNSLCQTLLEQATLPPLKISPDPGRAPTPAVKYLLQMLGEIRRTSHSLDDNQRPSGEDLNMDRMVAARLHAYSSRNNITINCCPRCIGDIFVV